MTVLEGGNRMILQDTPYYFVYLISTDFKKMLLRVLKSKKFFVSFYCTTSLITDYKYTYVTY